jgi:hypothetical protein
MDFSFIFGLLILFFVVWFLWVIGSGLILMAKKQKSSPLNIKIRKPAIALAIASIFWIILSNYGIEAGSFMLIDFCVFVFVYKFILAQARL